MFDAMGACCASLLGGGKDGGVELQAQQPKYKIGIPESCRGSKVKVSEDLTITGEGAALASAAIEQDAAYWEVKVVSTGTIRVGVARKLQSTDLDAGVAATTSPSDGSGKTWCLDSSSPGVALEEGDIIGVAFGQSDLPNLSFRKNAQASNPNAAHTLSSYA